MESRGMHLEVVLSVDHTWGGQHSREVFERHALLVVPVQFDEAVCSMLPTHKPLP
jgi:hypothetical protein